MATSYISLTKSYLRKKRGKTAISDVLFGTENQTVYLVYKNRINDLTFLILSTGTNRGTT
jgi:hypothetical protein